MVSGSYYPVRCLTERAASLNERVIFLVGGGDAVWKRRKVWLYCGAIVVVVCSSRRHRRSSNNNNCVVP